MDKPYCESVTVNDLPTSLLDIDNFDITMHPEKLSAMEQHPDAPWSKKFNYRATDAEKFVRDYELTDGCEHRIIESPDSQFDTDIIETFFDVYGTDRVIMYRYNDVFQTLNTGDSCEELTTFAQLYCELARTENRKVFIEIQDDGYDPILFLHHTKVGIGSYIGDQS